MLKVSIGGNEQTLHEFNGRKAIRAAKIVRSIGDAWPEVLSAIAKFRSEYEEQNAVVIDRATAKYRNPPIPVMDPDDPEGQRALTKDGPDGPVAVTYDRLGHMTEADWEASGQVLRIPQQPSKEEVFAAAFPVAFDHAEDQVMQLLALCTIDEDELGKAAREGGPESVTAVLKEEGERLLDVAKFEELIELAVVGAEMVEKQVREKVEALGDRVGNLLRLAGLGRLRRSDQEKIPETPTETSSTTPPPSSISSPASTDGESDESSTALVGASSAPSNDA